MSQQSRATTNLSESGHFFLGIRMHTSVALDLNEILLLRWKKDPHTTRGREGGDRKEQRGRTGV
jgi:hypothetical protein